MALASGANATTTTPPPEHPDIAGVVVDIPGQGGFATVIALADDTASLYTSTGGGTIGAGEHPEVAAATHRLLSALQTRQASFSGDDDGSHPPPGHVRFHVLTLSGTRFEDVPEDAFWGRVAHPLMPVVESTQELISAISQVSPP